jgi:hypothetical protein
MKSRPLAAGRRAEGVIGGGAFIAEDIAVAGREVVGG